MYSFSRDQYNNEQDRGYTSFFLWVFDHSSIMVHILGQCLTYVPLLQAQIIRLSSDYGIICLYDDVVLVAILDYFCLLKERGMGLGP